METDAINPTAELIDGFTRAEWDNLEKYLSQDVASSNLGDIATGNTAQVVEIDVPEGQTENPSTLSELISRIKSLHNEGIVGDTLKELHEVAEFIEYADSVDDEAAVKEYLASVISNVEAQKTADESADKAKADADAAIKKAKDEKLRLKQEKERTRTHTIPEGQIMWINGGEAEEVTIVQHVSQGGKVFWVGRTTEMSNRTSVDTNTISASQYKFIENGIIDHLGQKIDAPDHQYHSLRPLEDTGTTRDRTLLNSYKEDGITPPGFKSNDVRTLVLEDTQSITDQNIFYIASVCLHDDQDDLIYNL